MEIGIISDIHDNVKNLKVALELFKERKINEVIFCGDFCSPVPVNTLNEFEGRIHAVFGNGDGDRFTIQQKAKKNLILYGEYAEVQLFNRSICITHYPFYAKALAQLNKYDLVCTGHTHKYNVEKFKNSILVNPGDLLGLFDEPQLAIYDSISHSISIKSI